MTDRRSNKQILLDMEGKYGSLTLEVKEMRKTQEVMYTSFFGVPGTQDGGLIGSFNMARDNIKENHERIEGLTTDMALVKDRQKPSKRKQISFLGTIISAMVAILYGLGAKLGWWS